MAENFLINVKLNVDDSALKKLDQDNKRRIAEANRVASRASTPIPQAPAQRQVAAALPQTGQVSTLVAQYGRAAATEMQVVTQQMKKLGAQLPDVQKAQQKYLKQFTSSIENFQILPKNIQADITRRFNRAFDKTIKDFETALAGVSPARANAVVRNVANNNYANMGVPQRTVITTPAQIAAASAGASSVNTRANAKLIAAINASTAQVEKATAENAALDRALANAKRKQIASIEASTALTRATRDTGGGGARSRAVTPAPQFKTIQQTPTLAERTRPQQVVSAPAVAAVRQAAAQPAAQRMLFASTAVQQQQNVAGDLVQNTAITNRNRITNRTRNVQKIRTERPRRERMVEQPQVETVQTQSPWDDWVSTGKTPRSTIGNRPANIAATQRRISRTRNQVGAVGNFLKERLANRNSRGSIGSPKNEDYYYHGTSEPDLKFISPRMSGRAFPHMSAPGFAYATKDPGAAWSYAEKAWSQFGGTPRVYRVKPTGPVEKDPNFDELGRSRGNFDSDMRSRRPFKVVGSEVMPDNMGTPEDWTEPFTGPRPKSLRQRIQEQLRRSSSRRNQTGAIGNPFNRARKTRWSTDAFIYDQMRSDWDANQLNLPGRGRGSRPSWTGRLNEIISRRGRSDVNDPMIDSFWEEKFQGNEKDKRLAAALGMSTRRARPDYSGRSVRGADRQAYRPAIGALKRLNRVFPEIPIGNIKIKAMETALGSAEVGWAPLNDRSYRPGINLNAMTGVGRGGGAAAGIPERMQMATTAVHEWGHLLDRQSQAGYLSKNNLAGKPVEFGASNEYVKEINGILSRNGISIGGKGYFNESPIYDPSGYMPGGRRNITGLSDNVESLRRFSLKKGNSGLSQQELIDRYDKRIAPYTGRRMTSGEKDSLAQELALARQQGQFFDPNAEGVVGYRLSEVAQRRRSDSGYAPGFRKRYGQWKKAESKLSRAVSGYGAAGGATELAAESVTRRLFGDRGKLVGDLTNFMGQNAGIDLSRFNPAQLRAQVRAGAGFRGITDLPAIKSIKERLAALKTREIDRRSSLEARSGGYSKPQAEQKPISVFETTGQARSASRDRQAEIADRAAERRRQLRQARAIKPDEILPPPEKGQLPTGPPKEPVIIDAQSRIAGGGVPATIPSARRAAAEARAAAARVGLPSSGAAIPISETGPSPLERLRNAGVQGRDMFGPQMRARLAGGIRRALAGGGVGGGGGPGGPAPVPSAGPPEDPLERLRRAGVYGNGTIFSPQMRARLRGGNVGRIISEQLAGADQGVFSGARQSTVPSPLDRLRAAGVYPSGDIFGPQMRARLAGGAISRALGSADMGGSFAGTGPSMAAVPVSERISSVRSQLKNQYRASDVKDIVKLGDTSQLDAMKKKLDEMAASAAKIRVDAVTEKEIKDAERLQRQIRVAQQEVEKGQVRLSKQASGQAQSQAQSQAQQAAQAQAPLPSVKKLRKDLRTGSDAYSASQVKTLGQIGDTKQLDLITQKIQALKAVANQVRVNAIDPKDIAEADKLLADLTRAQMLTAQASAKAAAVSGGGPGGPGGPGGGGGGGRGRGGAGGGGAGGGGRNNIISKIRGLDSSSAAGFFGGGLLSTLRYSIPSALFFGAVSGIQSVLKEAEELQLEFAKIKSQFDATFGADSQQKFDSFKESIISIASETGLGASEIARFAQQLSALYSAPSGAQGPITIGGKSGQELAQSQTESGAKLAQTVGLPLAEITDGLTAASLAFNKSFEDIGNIAIAIEQKSGVLAKETIAFIGDIAPVAQEAGFSLEEFTALAAIAQQRSGRSGAALAEQFGRIIPAITQNKDALLQLALANDKLGTPEFITALNTGNAKDILFGIAGSYNTLSKSAKDTVTNLLGGRREAAAILSAFQNPEALKSFQEAAKDSTGLLEDRFQKVRDTITNTFQRLAENARQIGIALMESGLDTVIKTVGDGLGQVAKGLTTVLTLIGSFNEKLGGIPAKIIAAIIAWKLLSKAIAMTGIQGAAAGIASAGGGGAGGLLRGLALTAGAPLGNPIRAFRAGYSGLIAKGGMMGGGAMTARAAYQAQNAAYAASGTNAGLRPLMSGAGQGLRNTGRGLGAAGGAIAGSGILPLVAIVGLITAYSVIKSGVDNQNAQMDELNKFAFDANTGIADLEKKAREFKDYGKSGDVKADVNWQTKFVDWLTGAETVTPQDLIDTAISIKKTLQAQKTQDFINLLTANDQASQDVAKLLIGGTGGPGGLVGDGTVTPVEKFGGRDAFFGISVESSSNAAREYRKNIERMSGGTFGAQYYTNQYGIGVNLDRFDIANTMAEAGKKARVGDKFDVNKYIANLYTDQAFSGTRLNESATFAVTQYNASQGDQLAQAVMQRATNIGSLLNIDAGAVGTDVLTATSAANPIDALKKVSEDQSKPEEVRKQAADLIAAMANKDDAAVQAILTGNGAVDSALIDTSKTLEEIANAFNVGAIDEKTYLGKREEQKNKLRRAIETTKGDKTALYNELFKLEKEDREYLSKKAAAALSDTVGDLSLTMGSESLSAIQAKITATRQAIGSGQLSGDDLKQAANDLLQAEKEVGLALIRNATTAEEAAAIASQPIKISAEARTARVKAKMQESVGNWEAFTSTFQTIFGETADTFITSLNENLTNGSITAEQASKYLEQKSNDAKRAKKFYEDMMAVNSKPVDPQVLANYDAVINNIDAQKKSVDETGKLVGDPGGQISDAQAAFQNYSKTLDSIGSNAKASMGKNQLAKAQQDAKDATDAYNYAVANSLDEETIREADTKRKEANQEVIYTLQDQALLWYDLARAQATWNNDPVAAAAADIAKAQQQYRDAVANQDEAGQTQAIIAIGNAQKAQEDAILNQKRAFFEALKATAGTDILGEFSKPLSQDSLDQAQYDVNIAQFNYQNAKGFEEQMKFAGELANAQRRQREALIARKEAILGLNQAMTEDPVKQAQLGIAFAQDLLAQAETEDERINAQKRLIDEQKRLTEAMNQVRDSQFNLRQAELQAIGDDIGAAQTAAALARKQLQDAIAAGKGQAEINNLKAGVVNADKAVRDTVFQNRMDDYKFLLDMGQITQSQYADYLEGLKSTLIPGTKQFKDLEVTIKQLRDDIGGNLQSNLPTSLQLPTLYEVRRLNQMGQGGASGQGIGYQDNRNVQVTVYVNNGMSQGQVVDTLAKAMNVGTAGLESKRYQERG